MLEQHELANKSILLYQIHNARRAHQEWVKKAEKLVNGLDGYRGRKVPLNVDKTFIPLDSNRCEFGQWFNSYALFLSKFDLLKQQIEKIDEYHNAIHDAYFHIYTIFFITPYRRPLIQRIFTLNSKKVTELEREKAKIHLEYLKTSSVELLNALVTLEALIKGLDHHELIRLASK
jgi:hypothetical protein